MDKWKERAPIRLQKRLLRKERLLKEKEKREAEAFHVFGVSTVAPPPPQTTRKNPKLPGRKEKQSVYDFNLSEILEEGEGEESERNSRAEGVLSVR